MSNQLYQSAPGLPTASEWLSGAINASSLSTGSTNATVLYSMNFPCNISATKITYQIGTADDTGNLYDIGFYTASGTLVTHVGATAGTTFSPAGGAFVTLTFLTPCNLTANTRYYFALTGNANTAQLYRTYNYIMACGQAGASAGGTTSGGVLNGSITPPADSYGSNSYPYMVLHN